MKHKPEALRAPRAGGGWRARIAGAALGLLVAAMPFFQPGIPQALAQTPEAKPAETLRPEVAKPMQAAQEAINAKNFTEALAKLREASAIPELTPYETYFIERLRAAAAAGAGDNATAAKSLEAIVATGRMPAAEQLRAVEALASLYFKAKDYPKAVTWSTRYFKDGGTSAGMRMLQVQALYASGDYAEAAKQMRELVAAAEKAGTKPSQDDLRLVASAYAKLNDPVGYDYALGKLLAYYPNKEYWTDAIRRVESQPTFADALQLDVLRLLQATGNLESAAQYVAAAQLALKFGYPAEAKRIVEQGFAAGVLGKGADADAQNKLRDNAVRQSADDEKLAAQNSKDAAAQKDGTGLVNTGWALVTAGQYDKGLPMMEQGVQRGGLKRPDDAKLHLAIAYLLAGQKAKAIEAFKAVQGDDGTADLARLWLIHAQRSAS